MSEYFWSYFVRGAFAELSIIDDTVSDAESDVELTVVPQEAAAKALFRTVRKQTIWILIIWRDSRLGSKHTNCSEIETPQSVPPSQIMTPTPPTGGGIVRTNVAHTSSRLDPVPYPYTYNSLCCCEAPHVKKQEKEEEKGEEPKKRSVVQKV